MREEGPSPTPRIPGMLFRLGFVAGCASAPPKALRIAPVVALCLCSSLLLGACQSPSRRNASTPMIPGSSTFELEDADDPHRAALERLMAEPWGFGRDRDKQLAVPLPDHARWRRVKFRPFHFFVGFKYGSDYHALQAVRVEQLAAGEVADTRTCVRRMERWATPVLRSFDVELTQFEDRSLTWQGQPVLARTVDGRVDYGLTRLEFSAAWMAIPAYPSTCAVLAFAVPWRGSPQLARRVRDRWLEQSVRYVRPLSDELIDSAISRR